MIHRPLFRLFVAIVVFAVLGAVDVRADLFTTSPSTFASSVSGLYSAGVEDFETATGNGLVDDPLSPGVGNGAMPSGTRLATGLTIQSNTLGAAAGETLSPQGSVGLGVYVASLGFTSKILSVGNAPNSLDLLFSLPGQNVTAVGLNPNASDFNFAGGPVAVTARVYGASGLLGTFTLPAVGPNTAGSFIGIVAPSGQVITRINLSTSVAGMFVGVDNIAVHTLEPPPPPPQPEIAVERNGEDIPDNAIVAQSFGSHDVGAISSLSFTIKNTGLATLTGLFITVDGPDASMFGIGTGPASTVAGPNGTTTFTVRFIPTSSGVKTAALHISNNDSDEAPFDINLTGTGVIPGNQFFSSRVSYYSLMQMLPYYFSADIEDLESGEALGGSMNDPLSPGVANGPMPLGTKATMGISAQSNTLGAAAGTMLSPAGTDALSLATSSVFPGVSGFTSKFLTLNNPAHSLDLLFNVPGQTVAAIELNPNVSDSNFAGSAPVTARVYGASGLLGEFTLPNCTSSNTGSFISYIAPLGQVITRVNLSTTSPGFYVGADNIAFSTYEAPAQPDIVVEQNSANVSDGGAKSFPDTPVGSTSDLVFTVRNTGAGVLSLLGITFTEPDAARFSVTSAPASTSIGPGGSTTFTVRFTPVENGPKTAVLHLANNDADEAPFDIVLSGTGINGPEATFSSTTTEFNSQSSQFALAGVEDFESATSTQAFISDPLSPGVAKAMMPHGTLPATGLTVQSNKLGRIAGSTLSPLGADGLFLLELDSKCISAGRKRDSLDLLFDLPGQSIKAIRLNPNVSDDSFGGGPATVLARVYGTSGFLGEFTIENVGANSAGSFLGIVAPAGVSITRINLSTTANTLYIGADNIAVYTTAPAGRLDPSFGGGMDSGYDSYVQGLAVQPSGHIIAAGKFQQIAGSDRSNIGRLNGDGTADPTWTPSFGNDVGAVAVQADGKVVIAGAIYDNNGILQQRRLTRLHADGTVDGDFNPDIDEVIHSIAVQNDGKILICGAFITVNGMPRRSLARLNSDGTLDTSFDPQVLGPQPFVGYRSSILSIAIQDDGRIIIGGEIESIGGVSREGAARLNSDGTLDASWHPTGLGTAYCLTIQGTTGKCIVSSQEVVLGLQINHLARLNNDGTVDATYLSSGMDTFIYSMAAQSDGKLIFNGGSGTARLLADGEPDPSFDSGAPTVGAFTLAIQVDGKVLLAGGYGSFTVDGTTVRGVARMFNDPATHSLTVPSASRVEWLRGGSAPETTQVIFDVSTDHGETYSPLGFGTRISGGWELTGLSLPPVCQVRARARTSGGYYNGSSGLVDAAASFGEAAAPEIVVQKADGTNIVDGGTSAFGMAEIGATVDRTFVIRNTGSAVLTGIVATVDGANADAFTISTPPATTLGAPSGSTLLMISFTPTTGGAKTAVLHIASNDADESPFDITLAGTANSAPTFAGMTINTVQGKASAIAEAKILLRASDADGQAVTITDVAPFSEQGVALTRSGGVITYAAPAAFVGTDAFQVTLSDGVSSTQGTITMVVAGDPGLNPNNAPQVTVIEGGAVSLTFNGIPGRTYGIQRSTDLSNWTQIATPTAAVNGGVSITDNAPPQPAAFYRIIFPAQ